MVMVLLIALATSLTQISTSNLIQSKQRENDTSLILTTESLANLALDQLQNRSGLASALNDAKSKGEQELTEAVIAAAKDGMPGTGSDGQALNGLSVRATWRYDGAVDVPVYGVIRRSDVFRITTIAAQAGPANRHDRDGKLLPIQDWNHYRRHRVEVLVVPFANQMINQAIYAQKGFRFQGNATTDSWDSRDGTVPYGSVPSGSKGDLSSSGSISVRKRSNVKGNVNGSLTVPVPDIVYEPPGSAIPLPGPGIGALGTVKNLASGIYRCASLSLDKANSITLADGAEVTLYVDGPIVLKRDWTIPASCRLTIIQGNYDRSLGTTTVTGKIKLGCTTRPASFIWLSCFDGTLPGGTANPGLTWSMKGNGSFGGVLIAPWATLKISGTSSFYGSLYMGAFDKSRVTGNIKLHYDESLASTSIATTPRLAVVAWHASPVGTDE